MSENKTNNEMYDVIVIGAGPGGYHAAIRIAQYGAKVTIIEKDQMGGICTNVGCIPTKALYSSARLLEEIRNKAENLGVVIEGHVNIDFPKTIERKNKVVLESREGIEKLIKLRDIPIHNGFGKIEGGNSVSGFTVSIT
ncbi:MAG: FAD-dependent oxidoreductase, partial [archaeon]|nr:FAD-dependent oxidoreductase [archaeon]